MNVRLDGDPVFVSWSRGKTNVSVRVRPLALGFSRRFKERGLIPPTPPKSVARDSAGRAVRDGHGDPVLIADAADAGYQAAVERYHERLAVLMVAEAAGAELGLEAAPPSSDVGWLEYADAVAAEMREAGFTTGDLVRLCEAVCEASRLGSRDLHAAADSFFLEGSSDRSSRDLASPERATTSFCERANGSGCASETSLDCRETTS